jgi:hypothetical protein
MRSKRRKNGGEKLKPQRNSAKSIMERSLEIDIMNNEEERDRGRGRDRGEGGRERETPAAREKGLARLEE